MKRLRLRSIAEHIAAQTGFEGVHVGTGYDRDYLTAFGTTYPAVWVGAQKQQRRGDGMGSREYHQRGDAQIVVRLVVQRYADGETDPEQALDALHDAVLDVLDNWQPPEAWGSLCIQSTQDGPPHESVLTEDLIFECSTLYRGTP